MPVSFEALPRVPLFDATLSHHFLHHSRVELLRINAYSDAFGRLMRRLIDGKPLVLFDLLDAEAKLWVGDKDVQDKILDFFGEEGWQLEVRFQDLLVERLGVLVFEGKVATSFCIEDDACTPQVCFRPYVFFAFDELRSSIARGTTSS